MKKRRATLTQLRNLARGREINFQNKLRQKGIPKTIIQKELIREQPIINQNNTHQHVHQLKVYLFKELIGAKIFPLEINHKKENLNLQEMINAINFRLDNQWKNIYTNKNKIEEIISHVNSKEKEDDERFEKLEKRIGELEKENKKLKGEEKNEE